MADMLLDASDVMRVYKKFIAENKYKDTLKLRKAYLDGVYSGYPDKSAEKLIVKAMLAAVS